MCGIIHSNASMSRNSLTKFCKNKRQRFKMAAVSCGYFSPSIHVNNNNAFTSWLKTEVSSINVYTINTKGFDNFAVFQ